MQQHYFLLFRGILDSSQSMRGGYKDPGIHRLMGWVQSYGGDNIIIKIKKLK